MRDADCIESRENTASAVDEVEQGSLGPSPEHQIACRSTQPTVGSGELAIELYAAKGGLIITDSSPIDVLAIDDDRATAEVVCEICRDMCGLKSIPVTSLNEAARILGDPRSNVGIVFLDHMLNEPNWRDFASSEDHHVWIVKSLLQLRPEVKIVVMTSYPTPGLRAKSFQAGVFDYLIKPFELEESISSVHEAVRSIHADRERKKNSLPRKSPLV